MSLSRLRVLHRLSINPPRIVRPHRAIIVDTKSSPLPQYLTASANSFQHHRSYFIEATTAIMADNNAVTAGVEGAQHAAAAAAPAAQSSGQEDYIKLEDATTTAKNTDDNTNNDKEVGISQSKKDNNNKQLGKNNQKTKNAKWKQTWKEKKAERKRKNDVGDDGKNKRGGTHWKKKKYDDGPVPPHEGSFANEGMRKLFNVSIDDDVTAGDAAKAPSSEVSSSEGKANADEKEAITTTTTLTETTTNTAEEAASKTNKIPKRKVAILTSFLGTRYSGFQINTSMRTLQSELELGLHRAGIISKLNFGHPSKYSWSNSARTDKGVHAAAQVCSFKGEMIYHNDEEMNDEGDSESGRVRKQLDAMREHVNSFLPGDVRVLDIQRVTGGFCARKSRDKVRYQYMVPSYCLCSSEDVRKAFAGVVAGGGDAAKTATDEDSKLTPMEASTIIDETIDPATSAKAREALIGHRVTPQQMEQLKAGLKLFEGTHCFHNYTRRVGANEATATRYILSFKPLEPILVPSDDGTATQWIPLQVVGQSFLLNQIRKMVSAAVDHARGVVSSEKIKQSLTKEYRIKVNVAPAQGLFLDRSFFELYNKHKIKNAPKHGDSRDRDTLDWVEAEGEELPAGVRRVEEFKNDKIIPHIVQEEAAEGNFLKYIYAQEVLYGHLVYGLMEGDEYPKKKDKKNSESDEKNDGGNAGDSTDDAPAGK